MLVVRHTTTEAGAFCGPCILSTFWSCTLTTAFVGWFGFISCILTPVFIIANIWELIQSAKLVGWRKVTVAVVMVLAMPIAVIMMLSHRALSHGLLRR